MKKVVNCCSMIFLLLAATPQVKAQSVDVVIHEKREPNARRVSIYRKV